MAALATYMGHVNIYATYWYLEATADFLRDVATASEAFMSEGRSACGSAIEFWPSSADGFWPTPGPSTYGRPSRSGGLAWTGEPKWICSSSFVGSMNSVLGR